MALPTTEEMAFLLSAREWIALSRFCEQQAPQISVSLF